MKKWLLLLLVLAGMGVAAFLFFRPKAPRGSPLLTIYFTCDTHGRLVPCGCFTGQYGGLTRLRTVLSNEKANGSLRFDVGDAVGGAEDYDAIQYRYLLRAYSM